MKKSILVLMVGVMALLFADAAMAAIKLTKHNLGMTGQYSFTSTNETEICVFCHTPHNAVLNVPLWNRSQQSGGYMLYTASATLTSAAGNASITSANISFLCLGCHDGTIGLGAGVANNREPNPIAGLSKLDGSAKLGTDLTNDHPVGFNYQSASGEDNTINNTITNNKVAGELPLFRVSGVDNFLECASCHNVHNNTNIPFLRKTNDSSALCLTCHLK